MTKEQAIEEINKVFEPAYADYIITALTEGATVSDKALEQQPSEDVINRKADNLCNSCINYGCEFQSGIVRTKCAFYMPPNIETDNCVSRAELKKWLDMNFSFGGALRKLEMFDRIDKELLPVTPTFPKGATNGDILEAVFPNIERKHDVSFSGWMESNWIECDGKNITHDDWWDAPYTEKRGNEE